MRFAIANQSDVAALFGKNLGYPEATYLQPAGKPKTRPTPRLAAAPADERPSDGGVSHGPTQTTAVRQESRSLLYWLVGSRATVTGN